MVPDDIGAVGRVVPDRDWTAAGREADHQAAARAGGEAPARDRLDLQPPVRAALGLLRQQVLLATCRRLGVDVTRAPRLEGREPASIAEFAGRLLSERNLLQRAAPARDLSLLDDAFVDGAASTLSLLHEVDELDLAVWDAVRGVVGEVARKTAAAAQPPSPGPTA